MDEQRLEAYLNLIQALLNCPEGEDSEILDVHQDLIDNGLVQTMEQVAVELVDEGDQDAADWLRDVAEQLAATLDDSSAAATPEAVFDFLK